MSYKSDSSNPLEHTSKIKGELSNLTEHMREDIKKIDDPAAKALLEVSAEVLAGLQKAFTDFEKKNEKAWQN